MGECFIITSRFDNTLPITTSTYTLNSCTKKISEAPLTSPRERPTKRTAMLQEIMSMWYKREGSNSDVRQN